MAKYQKKRKKFEQKIKKDIMIAYTSTQREYRIWSPQKRCIFAQIAVTFDKTKSSILLLNTYLFITTSALSANLPANLSFISHALRK